jgi:hypothetical protein
MGDALAPAEPQNSPGSRAQTWLACAGGLLAFVADLAAIALMAITLASAGRRGLLVGGAVLCAVVAVVVMLLVATLLNKPRRVVAPLRAIWFLSWAILLAAAIVMFFGPRLGV